jgi:hypothetical protein
MPEVPATAAQGPEQIGVFDAGHTQHLAVGGHHLHRQQVVACPAVAARQVAEAATHREPGDAGGRDEAEHRGQAVQLRLAVDVGERAAGLRPGHAPRRVHPHAAQRRHVDHQAAVAHRQPGNVVAAAAD